MTLTQPSLLLPHPCDFTIDHFEFLLRRSLSLGYEFRTHRDYQARGLSNRPVILLRHDIDLSLKKSFPLIRLEHSLGISSTIFVRVHARGYNLFDLENYALLRQYRSWGHEIGLHYEPSFLEATREDPARLLQRAKAVLESILDERVYGLVSHAPRLAPLSGEFDTTGMRALGFLYSGNEPVFTSESFYVSDANRNWRKGCLCQHVGKRNCITLLVHPFWWEPMRPDDKYKALQLIRDGG